MKAVTSTRNDFGRVKIEKGKVKAPPKKQNNGEELSKKELGKYGKIHRLAQKPEAVIFDYEDLLNVAQVSRSPMVLVLAELHHKWFKNQIKSEPVILDNTIFKACGFSHKDKWKALNCLEQLGMIKIEKRKNMSPLVSVLFKKNHGLSFGQKP